MTETMVAAETVAKTAKAVIVEEKTYTVDEYFELEKRSTIRHEYHFGKLIAMPGESKNANEIAQNCAFAFRNELRKRGFRIFMQDVRTIVKDNKIYRYPDVVVADEKDDSDSHNITKPRILIEVTSDSSKYRDSVTKLREYSKLPSLDYYVVIDQEIMSVEVYSRLENGWHYELLEERSETISFVLFDMTISLETIYENITFPEGITKSDIEETAP